MNTMMSLEEARQWGPTKKYTDAQKIAAFDRLYNSAATHFLEIKESLYIDDDDKEEIYEEVMELLGDKVWFVINTLIG